MASLLVAVLKPGERAVVLPSFAGPWAVRRAAELMDPLQPATAHAAAREAVVWPRALLPCRRGRRAFEHARPQH